MVCSLYENGFDVTESQMASVESLVKSCWMQALDVAVFVPESDFFELGGDSVAAVQIAAQIRRELGIRINLMLFFESPRFDEFVAVVQHLSKESRNE